MSTFISSYREAITALSKEPKIPVSVADFTSDGREHGVVLLDFDIEYPFDAVTAGYFSLFFNELGLPSDNVEEISILSPKNYDVDDIKAQTDLGNITVLYDFTNTLDSVIPHDSFRYHERGSFKNDRALEWKYVGDIGLIPEERRKIFHRSAQASFELTFMRNLFGQVEATDLRPLGYKLYDRAKEVFDAIMVGYAEFPMTQEQVDDMLEYLCFVDRYKDFSPRPMTPGASVIPIDDVLREYGTALVTAGKLVHSAIELWDNYSRSSGAGMMSIELSSYMLRDPYKMPLNAITRKNIADVIGVSSAIDALVNGVPLQDLLT